MLITLALPREYKATAAIRKGSNVAIRVTPRKWQVGKVYKKGKVILVEVEDGAFEVELEDASELLKELKLSHLSEKELAEVWSKTYSATALKSLDNIKSTPAKKETTKKETTKKETTKKETTKKETTKKETTKKETTKKETTKISEAEKSRLRYDLSDGFIDPLSPKSLPKELKDPEKYALSTYGRVVNIPGKGKAVVVGTSIARGVEVWAISPLFRNPGKRFYWLQKGMKGVGIEDKSMNEPQVTLAELAKHRKTVYDNRAEIDEHNDGVKSEGRGVADKLDLKVGDVVAIKFKGNKLSRHKVLGIDISKATIMIQGSGSKRRSIPLFQVVRKVDN